jgi:hypothetical protein
MYTMQPPAGRGRHATSVLPGSARGAGATDGRMAIGFHASSSRAQLSGAGAYRRKVSAIMRFAACRRRLRSCLFREYDFSLLFFQVLFRCLRKARPKIFGNLISRVKLSFLALFVNIASIIVGKGVWDLDHSAPRVRLLSFSKAT